MPEAPKKHAGGRPRKHNRAKIMRAVCDRMSNGEFMQDVAKDLKVDRSQIIDWSVLPEFSPAYARARELQAHAIAADALRLADAAKDQSSENVQAHRLMVDTRKWLASKMAPRHYGDKLDVTTDNKPINGVIYLPAPDKSDD